MKTQGLRHRHGGFSLIELVVVVAIIAVLAALSMAGFGMVTQKNARSQATVQIKLLEDALGKYHADNRSYPKHADPNGERGDEALYKALYWDGLQNRDSGGVIYLPELDPLNNGVKGGGQKWMQGQGEQARILDPWGNYFRYRSDESPGAINPDFDIWSVGRDGVTNADPKHKDSLDDIKNW